MKPKNSNCDETQIMMNLRNLNCKKKILSNSNRDETQKLNFVKNKKKN